MEQEFLKQALFQIIRWFAGPIIGWLSLQSGVTEEQTTAVLVGAAVGAVMFVWGLANKWRAEKKVEVALELPQGTSRERLKEVVANK